MKVRITVQICHGEYNQWERAIIEAETPSPAGCGVIAEELVRSTLSAYQVKLAEEKALAAVSETFGKSKREAERETPRQGM